MLCYVILCYGIDISSEPTLEHSGVNYMPRGAGIEPAAWLSGILTLETADIVGFAAGSYYSHTGGGVNYQCLPLQPEYNSYTDSGSPSWIYGVEYESGNNGLLPGSTQNQNVPCARCLSRGTAVMMLPAKRTCPQGWTKEYEGIVA